MLDLSRKFCEGGSTGSLQRGTFFHESTLFCDTCAGASFRLDCHLTTYLDEMLIPFFSMQIQYFFIEKLYFRCKHFKFQHYPEFQLLDLPLKIFVKSVQRC